jgi:hypothetical protein
MHSYAASRATDGVACYALGKRSEGCCDSGDDCGKEADMALLLLGQARSSADMPYAGRNGRGWRMFGCRLSCAQATSWSESGMK